MSAFSQEASESGRVGEIHSDNLVYTGVSPTPPPVCKCSNPWICEECRRYRANKIYKSNLRWLSEAINDSTEVHFVAFTVRTGQDWQKEVEELFHRWSTLGKLRTMLRKRKKIEGFGSIVRGTAFLHLTNQVGALHPHLHALIVAKKSCNSSANIIEAWNSLGPGYCEPQKCRSLRRALRYTVNGQIPQDEVLAARLRRHLFSKKTVRRIGGCH